MAESKSTPSTSSNPEKTNILSELECPVCTNYMFPPIYLCATGHSICNICEENIPVCPICKKEIGSSRNYVLEKIIEKLNLACKYSDRGCQVTGMGNIVEPHQHHCQFGDIVCLNQIINQTCNWKGMRKDMFEHFKSQHKADTAETCFKSNSAFKLSLKKFAEDPTKSKAFIYLCSIDNKIFALVLRKNITVKYDSYVPFCVYFLGDPAECKRFRYKIGIKHSSVSTFDEVPLEISAQCQPLETNKIRDLFQSPNCMIIHYRMLKLYCSEEGTLNFNLQIDEYFHNAISPNMPRLSQQ